MSKRRIIFILLLLLFSAATVGLLVRATKKGPPVTIRFVKIGSFEHYGTLYNGTTLWITNNTEKPFLVMVRGIEVLNGKDWTKYRLNKDCLLRFSLEERRAVESALPPHQAGYATFEGLERLPAAPWRLRMLLGTQLSGAAAIWANLKDIPHDLLGGGSKQTGVSLNPLRGAYENRWVTIDVFTNWPEQNL